MPIFGIHFVKVVYDYTLNITLLSLLVYEKLVVAIATLWSWYKEVGWLLLSNMHDFLSCIVSLSG